MKVWKWGYEADRYDSFTFPNSSGAMDQYSALILMGH